MEEAQPRDASDASEVGVDDATALPDIMTCAGGDASVAAVRGR